MANNKGLDSNGLLYFGQQFLSGLRNIFQAKESGKGLSTNDYTNEDKAIVGAAVTDVSSLAPKASPEFSGTPTAPTAAVGTNSTQIATTAFVKAALDNYTPTINGPLSYKGSCTYANLPASPAVGDMWDVTDAHGDYPAGTDYAWNGTSWDPLGGKLVIEYMTNTEVQTVVNTIFA